MAATPPPCTSTSSAFNSPTHSSLPPDWSLEQHVRFTSAPARPSSRSRCSRISSTRSSRPGPPPAGPRATSRPALSLVFTPGLDDTPTPIFDTGLVTSFIIISTTGRAGGMRKAPKRGRQSKLRWPWSRSWWRSSRSPRGRWLRAFSHPTAWGSTSRGIDSAPPDMAVLMSLGAFLDGGRLDPRRERQSL